jgi:hypothetical protein
VARRDATRGFSHNVRYHTRIYHVQTAFVGGDDAQVVSHLFVDGMIVTTKRSDCAAEEETERVQALMKDQHRQMLRGLRRGDFDERVVMLLGRLKVSDDDPWEEPAAKPPPPPPPPPPSKDMSPAEARAIRRGRRISRELAPLAGQPPGEIPIPLEHPAFSAIPMIEWEESERTDSLELDLDAIDDLNLDEAKTAFVRRDSNGPGGELDLDALYDDEDDEALLAAFPSPLPEADQEEAKPSGEDKDWDPPTPVERDTAPPLAKIKTDEMPLESKHPSLPLPMIGEEVDEAFFHKAPVDEELAERELSEAEREFSNRRQLKTLTFPPPFLDPPEEEGDSPDSSDSDKDK